MKGWKINSKTVECASCVLVVVAVVREYVAYISFNDPKPLNFECEFLYIHITLVHFCFHCHPCWRQRWRHCKIPLTSCIYTTYILRNCINVWYAMMCVSVWVANVQCVIRCETTMRLNNRMGITVSLVFRCNNIHAYALAVSVNVMHVIQVWAYAGHWCEWEHCSISNSNVSTDCRTTNGQNNNKYFYSYSYWPLFI